MNIFEDEYIEPKESEKLEVIEKIRTGKYGLSFSSLAAFSISPRAFIAYKVQERKVTNAMLQGQMLHAYVLEPDQVAEKFLMMPEANLATTEGKKIVAEWCDKLFGFSFENNKQGNPVLPKIDDLRKMIADKDGRPVVPMKVAEDAKKAAYAIIRNKSAMSVLSRVTETEKRFTTEFRGVYFAGVIDGKGPRLILDLKQVPDASIDSGTGAFYKRKMSWQLAGYNRAIGGGCDCFAIMVDNTGEVLVTQVSSSTLERAERQMSKMIDAFKEAVLKSHTDESVWYQSQDYWLRSQLNPNGYNVL